VAFSLAVGIHAGLRGKLGTGSREKSGDGHNAPRHAFVEPFLA
jgi:hypothetical protein